MSYRNVNMLSPRPSAVHGQTQQHHLGVAWVGSSTGTAMVWGNVNKTIMNHPYFDSFICTHKNCDFGGG